MDSLCTDSTLSVCLLLGYDIFKTDCSYPFVNVGDYTISHPVLIVFSALVVCLVPFMLYRLQEFSEESGFGEHSFSILLYLATTLVQMGTRSFNFQDSPDAVVWTIALVGLTICLYITILWGSLYDIGVFFSGCVSSPIALFVMYILVFISLANLSFLGAETTIFLFYVISIIAAMIFYVFSCILTSFVRHNWYHLIWGSFALIFFALSLLFTLSPTMFCSAAISTVSLGTFFAHIAFFCHFRKTLHVKDDEAKADEDDYSSCWEFCNA